MNEICAIFTKKYYNFDKNFLIKFLKVLAISCYIMYNIKA